MENTVRQWTKAQIVALLDSNDKAVARALVRLYQYQTQDEQSTLETKHTNGVGFNSADARTLTDIAQKCQRFGGTLTPRQTALVRRRIRKYAGQLVAIANAQERS